MCLNCPCGEPNERHKPGDFTLDDLKRAAANHGMAPEQAADDIHAGAKKPKEAGRLG